MEFLQWAIPIVVGILGVLAGRAWQRHDRNVEKDKEVHAKILEILPHESLLFFKRHDFSGSFNKSQVRPIRELVFECERADFIYIDSMLERQRMKLRTSIQNFIQIYYQEVFDFDSPEPNSVRVRYPEDFRDEQARENFSREAITSKLNELADTVWENYENLLKTARKKL
jgi:hypothetical protein